MFRAGPTYSSASGSAPVLTSNFHLGGRESPLPLSFSQRPSVLRPPPLMPPPSAQASICPSPLSLYLPLKKQGAVKRGWLLLCALWPTVCAQRSVLHLLNPSAGPGSKGRLGSCKGPFSSPSLLPPFLWAEKTAGRFLSTEGQGRTKRGTTCPRWKARR